MEKMDSEWKREREREGGLNRWIERYEIYKER